MIPCALLCCFVDRQHILINTDLLSYCIVIWKKNYRFYVYINVHHWLSIFIVLFVIVTNEPVNSLYFCSWPYMSFFTGLGAFACITFVHCGRWSFLESMSKHQLALLSQGTYLSYQRSNIVYQLIAMSHCRPQKKAYLLALHVRCISRTFFICSVLLSMWSLPRQSRILLLVYSAAGKFCPFRKNKWRFQKNKCQLSKNKWR